MASFNFNIILLVSIIMAASMQFPGTKAQTTHIVGDSIGWSIPADGTAAYTAWASRQTFVVGDTLIFNFATGLHDVAEVSGASYEPCNSNNPISLATNGPATILLTTAGTHYYICTFTSHCQIGQKLTINVTGGSAPATPPSATMVPPTTTTATPPSTMPTTPSEPCPPTSSPTSSPFSPPSTNSGNTPQPPLINSGASSLSTMLAGTTLMIGLAFFNY